MKESLYIYILVINQKKIWNQNQTGNSQLLKTTKRYSSGEKKSSIFENSGTALTIVGTGVLGALLGESFLRVNINNIIIKSGKSRMLLI